MMNLKNEDIKIGPISKSEKHEALEKVLEIGEHLYKRIKKIDGIIANEKGTTKRKYKYNKKIIILYV
jgi:hypothetical protein